MRKGIFLFLALCLFPSCEVSEPRDIRLEFVIRSSCGRSPANYDLSCLAALDIRVVDENSNTKASQCTDVRGRYGSVRDLIASTDILAVTDKLEPYENAIIEVRGYHAFDKEACTDAQESELLLWGRSELVSLAEESTNVISLHTECRPTCDCEKLGEDISECPVQMSPGICAPLETVNCRKVCGQAESCYGGELNCSGGLCSPLPGGLCWECESSSDCDIGRCVQNTEISDQEVFCAPSCPEELSAHPCPTNMSCKLVGQTPYQLFP